jgi:hypothetical protein
MKIAMAEALLKSVRDFPKTLDNPGEEYTYGDLVQVFRAWSIEAKDCLKKERPTDGKGDR